MSYFHEEQTFARWIPWVLVGIVAVPSAIAAAASPARPDAAYPTLAVILVFVIVAALFSAARLVVDVDRDRISVSFHFLWPTRRIGVADIRRAHATRYNALIDYGGWGVRLSFKGWAFNTGGSEGVLVETNDGKRVMIGSRRATELEAAIGRAVAERGAAR